MPRIAVALKTSVHFFNTFHHIVRTNKIQLHFNLRALVNFLRLMELIEHRDSESSWDSTEVSQCDALQRTQPVKRRDKAMLVQNPETNRVLAERRASCSSTSATVVTLNTVVVVLKNSWSDAEFSRNGQGIGVRKYGPISFRAVFSLASKANILQQSQLRMCEAEI